MTIFITLGSQKFQFNRLLKEIDKLIEEGTIVDEVFAQIGSSDYVPKHFKYKHFLDRDEFKKYMEKSDVVITHGGTGAIIGAVKKGKKVIAVPRLAKYGEHVDDHQIQIVNQFSQNNLIKACNVSEIKDELLDIYDCCFDKYESNTNAIVNSIDDFIKEQKYI